MALIQRMINTWRSAHLHISDLLDPAAILRPPYDLHNRHATHAPTNMQQVVGVGRSMLSAAVAVVAAVQLANPHLGWFGVVVLVCG